MLVVDAFWEERNLGKKTCEITVSENDSFSSFTEEFLKVSKDYEYICLKCSVNKPDFLFTLNELGFTFIETQVALKLNIKDRAISPKILDLFNLYQDRLSIQEMTNDEFISLKQRLMNSEMFRTDRIYLDTYFDKTAAGKRYSGWLDDLRNKGSKFLSLNYESRPVGFYEFNPENGKNFKTALGGIYLEEDEYSFLFPVFCMKVLQMFQENGMRTVSGAVSSNNPAVLKMHLATGYQIATMQYVYVWHQDNPC